MVSFFDLFLRVIKVPITDTCIFLGCGSITSKYFRRQPWSSLFFPTFYWQSLNLLQSLLCITVKLCHKTLKFLLFEAKLICTIHFSTFRNINASSCQAKIVVATSRDVDWMMYFPTRSQTITKDGNSSNGIRDCGMYFQYDCDPQDSSTWGETASLHFSLPICVSSAFFETP